MSVQSCPLNLALTFWLTAQMPISTKIAKVACLTLCLDSCLILGLCLMIGLFTGFVSYDRS